jgi:hypothetical protein
VTHTRQHRSFGQGVKSAVLSSKGWIPTGLLKADTATGGQDGQVGLDAGHSNVRTGTLLTENKELRL